MEFLNAFPAVSFELNYQYQCLFLQEKKRLGRIFAHYAWHKDLQMQWLEFLESTAFYCLRICCKIQESRHWLMLFSSSGLDQWETDPMSWSQLSCQLHSWHKGTCEYHTISTFNPASNPIHLDLQSNKKWHPECCGYKSTISMVTNQWALTVQNILITKTFQHRFKLFHSILVHCFE